MSNLSPGFNDRFANIELDQNGKQAPVKDNTPRKQYLDGQCPTTTTGLHTTPSKGPKLSTALRAESRSLSSKSKPLDLVQTVHKRNLQVSRAKDDPSPAPSEREKQQKKYPGISSMSFMRDTSSSRKKQSTVSSSGFPQLRSPSNMDVYTRRTRSQTLMKKRQFSKSSHVSQVGQNDMDIDFSDRPTVFSTAPPSHNLSPKSQHNSSEYMKLYKTTSMPAFNLPRERSRKNLAVDNQAKPSHRVTSESKILPPKPPMHQIPSHRSHLHKSVSNGNIRQHAEDSSMPKSGSRRNLNIKHLAFKTKASGARDPSIHSEPQPQQKPKTKKPSTVNEVFKFIHKADPSFFRETTSSDDTLHPNEAYSATQILNGPKGKILNMYERGEIIRSSKVYYIPEPPTPYGVTPDVNISNFKDNYGFDDVDGNYIVKPKGHIEYRYEILSTLGTGSFGNVVLCRDHKYQSENKPRYVAIKIIKNDLNWSLQAVSEIKMLKHLSSSRQFAEDHIMAYCDHFHFRGHMCIVTEALSLNLYTFLELGQFRGLSLRLLRSVMAQILKGLEFIHDKKVIHCDIKPENIMVKLPSHFDADAEYNDSDLKIKLIDFGSSCFDGETSFSYIQSRFYRAPEVILGALYSYEIDVWSLGCVCAELFTGCPLLPGKNELEQIALILEMFGPPPSTLIIHERKRLLKYTKGNLHKALKDPLASDSNTFAVSKMHVDEKKLKKTLLYSLYNAEGKINLQFLNLQLQSMESRDSESRGPSPFKRSLKLSSRNIEIALRLPSSGESKRDQAEFSRFLSSMFQWDPKERATSAQLLQSKFITEF